MRSFVMLLLILVIAIVGLGFYRGWFEVGSTSQDGKSNVNFTIDQEKIKADQKEAAERLRNIGQTTTNRDETTPETVLPDNGKQQTP